MAASYPGSIKSFTTKTDSTDVVRASHINDLQDEVVAVETELGITTSPASDSVRERLNSLEAADLGLDIKNSCLVATAAALPACTYANGTAGLGATLTGDANGALAAQDGITLVVGNRILVKDQSAGLQHGIYTVTVVGAGGAAFVLTRATDCDTALNMTAGAFAWIEKGTTNDNTGWVLTTDSFTIGTNAVTFAQYSAGSFTLATLSDTDVSSEASGNVLVYDGSNSWDNKVVSGDATLASTGAITIAADAVTYAKIQNVTTTDRLLGRDSAGAGVIEEITPANTRTMLNVEDGADVTDATNVTAAGALMDSELSGLAAVKATTGTFLTADQTKLDTIATSANNYTLPEANATTKGGIELFSNTDQSVAATAVSTTASRTYGLQLNSDGQGVVNVPWADTNTTYSVTDGELSEINFTSADHTKLNAIEASADVTDTTNVTAAGAVMDSEILDSDSMSGVSATLVSSSESIKAYVDAQTASAGVSEGFAVAMAIAL
jgi:hypothetical protein